MTNISGAELKELREEVLNHTEKKEEKDTKIIFDGRQYSIRFPKRFIDEAQVNAEEDFFRIKLHVPEFKTQEKPKLTAELIRGEDEKAKTPI
jgi:hypothetical protein